MTANATSVIEERIHRGALALNREALTKQDIFAVSLFGGPGGGKTSLLEKTLQHLGPRLRVAVILGNLQAQQDANRLFHYCQCVVPMETVDLTPELLRQALMHVDLMTTDLVLIERGAEAPPYPWDLGQSATVGLFSLVAGQDKVRNHTERIAHADLLLLSKIDQLPFVPFDNRQFEQSVRAINSTVPMLGISVVTGQGMTSWCEWLTAQVEKRHPAPAPVMPRETDYYIG